MRRELVDQQRELTCQQRVPDLAGIPTRDQETQILRARQRIVHGELVALGLRAPALLAAHVQLPRRLVVCDVQRHVALLVRDDERAQRLLAVAPGDALHRCSGWARGFGEERRESIERSARVSTGV
jgi:hypothetical protein